MLEALALLTPFGGARALSGRATPWFPWVGALLGLLVGAAWWAAAEVWPPLVAAAIAVAVDLGVTGLLHVDGLADSADGLLPHLDRERRLAVMAEPSVGAYGVAVVATTLLLRWAVLASVPACIPAIVAFWMLGRLVMTVSLTLVAPARPGGMAALVADTNRTAMTVSCVAAVAASAALLAHFDGAPALVAGAAAGAGVVLLARRKLGGITGDVLGAAGLVAETVALVVWSAQW